MALKVSEIRAWLDEFGDDDLVGIDEEGFNLTLSDERYDGVSLEIGMALSSEFRFIRVFRG